MTPSAQDEVASALARSRKYARVSPDALRRVAAWALARYPKRRAAVKAAKRKLHQVVGAYLDDFDRAEVRAALAALAALPERPSLDDLCGACACVLDEHASTAERLPFLNEAFTEVFRVTGRPNAVADLACGLGPFMLPWMDLPEGARYEGFDVDGRVVDAASVILSHARAIDVEGSAACVDLLTSMPDFEADVALILKTLPCLERQEPGAGERVVREALERARRVVVSFPARSLGGREKGMRETYADYAAGLAADLGLARTEIAFPTETFYVLRRLES